ncbi:DUF2269 family protein [Cohnella sp. CFH 77786]|uniref:DUF2269 family protein n=1 Tax=Cohnella sp. CFH 77786 TaxID=2662265 RepID=UPI001C60EBD4|nr:DUF2269 family protein [Cohnella sp. CFH 77786]MBW5446054.1 DUF2269 family protein [Cohnella sp. CFH 77786]
MEWLVLVHVLSAVLGLGPAFAFPFVMRKAETHQEMLRTVLLVNRLEMFPKIFGTLAVLSGLLLFWLGSYGSWLQVWILGTLLVYVAIEVLVVGFLNPAASKLQRVLVAQESVGAREGSAAAIQLYGRVRALHLWAGILGVAIFALMVLKP